ncbi:MAG TPA: hypothetical protein VKB72_04615 [Steroidobacteraceae bacterium]|nr:hypothetical protein [Steroidobacteraceae bacterium]
MRIWLLVAAVGLTARAAPVLADRDPNSGAPLPPAKHAPASPITDHFWIRAAYFAPQAHTTLRVDPTNAAPGTIGTPVNAENDLGLPKRLHQGRVDFMFRLRERSKVRVDYYEAKRSGSQVLANDIVFGNETFGAGQLTNTTLNWQQFDITYTYSFIRNTHFELGTGLAVYFLQLDAIGQVPAQNQRQEVSAATPFPALPLDFTWCISRRWAVTARAAYLRANINGFSGWYVDHGEDVQYRWNPNFVVGAGYAAIRTSLSRNGGSFPGAFAMSLGGPELFLRFSF